MTDPTSDRPTLAILGAGPVGLEAALAACDAGLDFVVYEAADQVAANVRDWSHVQLFTSWDLNVSPRARRHLERAELPVPKGPGRPTGGELVEELLEPLAELPWIAPLVRTGVEVVRVGREGLLKNDEIGTGGRAGRSFRILLREEAGWEWVEYADAVLDCTGTYHQPNALGQGGIPAPGEDAVAQSILRRIPNPADLRAMSGERILLVGGGHSAQTAARALEQLAEAGTGTRVIWAVRNPEPTFGLVEDDALPSRAELNRTALRLAGRSDGRVAEDFETARGTTVHALKPTEAGVSVTLGTPSGERSVVVDRILSLTGSVGDASLYRQLQVHECYATLGPMNLSAALLGAGAGADCMAQPTLGVEALRNPEPQFFILGSKAYGRNNTFLLRTGWEQVDEVMPVLAEELEELATGEGEITVDPRSRAAAGAGS